MLCFICAFCVNYNTWKMLAYLLYVGIFLLEKYEKSGMALLRWFLQIVLFFKNAIFFHTLWYFLYFYSLSSPYYLISLFYFHLSHVHISQVSNQSTFFSYTSWKHQTEIFRCFQGVPKRTMTWNNLSILSPTQNKNTIIFS